MKVSRRVVRSGLIGTGLAVAFVFMASIIVPERSQAGADGGLPDVPTVPDRMSAEAIEAMTPMGRIEGNLYSVEVFGTPTGPLFNVFDRHGNELAALLTPAEVAEQFPDLPLAETHVISPRCGRRDRPSLLLPW
ncbi:MAG: hypothetical protein ACYSU7_19850 [Planctomycetota bacterium]